MKRLLYVFLSLTVLLAACGPAAPAAGPTTTPTLTETAASPATEQPTAETTPTQSLPTLPIPAEGYGPSNFPSNVDPLTGLQVADPALLERRPMLIKVSNIGRNNRPQWGLSLADTVFEYYTEEGNTRFAAIFLGNNADKVGPIRSGRFIDAHLVRGYKALFVFGSAYIAEMKRYTSSDFADRLFIGGEDSNSPFSHYDPNGYDFLLVDTAALSAYATSKGVENGRQNLDGMTFKPEPPAGGAPGTQVYIRYSGVIYNRWDYDPTTGKYLRFADAANDYDNVKEVYAQLTDRLTNRPIAFDNLVVLYATHELYSLGIYDIQLIGSGDGVAFRDGQAYQVKWSRGSNDVVSLTNLDGTPFPFKPGTTWFSVVGATTQLTQTDQYLRFTHYMP